MFKKILETLSYQVFLITIISAIIMSWFALSAEFSVARDWGVLARTCLPAAGRMSRNSESPCHCPPQSMCPQTAEEWETSPRMPIDLAFSCCPAPNTCEERIVSRGSCASGGGLTMVHLNYCKQYRYTGGNIPQVPAKRCQYIVGSYENKRSYQDPQSCCTPAENDQENQRIQEISLLRDKLLSAQNAVLSVNRCIAACPANTNSLVKSQCIQSCIDNNAAFLQAMDEGNAVCALPVGVVVCHTVIVPRCNSVQFTVQTASDEIGLDLEPRNPGSPKPQPPAISPPPRTAEPPSPHDANHGHSHGHSHDHESSSHGHDHSHIDGDGNSYTHSHTHGGSSGSSGSGSSGSSGSGSSGSSGSGSSGSSGSGSSGSSGSGSSGSSGSGSSGSSGSGSSGSSGNLKGHPARIVVIPVSPVVDLRNWASSRKEEVREVRFSGVVNTARDCLAGGTLVTLADGSKKAIEDLKVGDKIQGFASINTVLGVSLNLTSEKELYSVNNGALKLTGGHPLMVEGGWAAIDPKGIKFDENFKKRLRKLEIGDVVFIEKDKQITITKIEQLAEEEVPIQRYNLSVDGDKTFYANGFVTRGYKNSISY